MAQKKASTQKSSVAVGAAIVVEDKSLKDKLQQKKNELAEKELKYSIIEDIFNNYSINSSRIYRVNFLRGLFFGAGSVIGGTVGIAFLVWFLSLFIEMPLLGEAIRRFLEALTHKP